MTRASMSMAVLRFAALSTSAGRAALATVSLLALFTTAWSASAATPDSPEVKKAVERGLKYLDTATHDKLGGKCIIGLAFLKNGHREAHPQIAAAVEACKEATKGEPEKIRNDIYSTGIAIIFLCELDPSFYHEQIRKLMKSMELRQKPHGGWGYAEKSTGDTSMTQYGALSTWEAMKVGISVPPDSVERLANWLLRTQDPSGGWGYQGTDPGTTDSGGIKRVKQDRVQLALSAAGLGSTYICGDLLELSKPPPVQNDPSLPAVLIPVRDAPKADPVDKDAPPKKVDAAQLKRSQELGTAWMRENFKIDPKGFTHYYLYALERFHSFADAAEGRNPKEPSWYNEGVKYLVKTQNEDGSWKSHDGTGPAVDTAFGVLFLVRSTKKSIEKAKSFGGGRLTGGQGLPADLKTARLRDGKIVGPPPNLPAAQFADVLAKPNDVRFRDLAEQSQWAADQLLALPAVERAAEFARLTELMRKGTSDTRIATLRILGRARLLQHVPLLIAALSDADLVVAQQASETLEQLSRRTNAPSINAAVGKSRDEAIDYWKDWYASIYPQVIID